MLWKKAKRNRDSVSCVVGLDRIAAVTWLAHLHTGFRVLFRRQFIPQQDSGLPPSPQSILTLAVLALAPFIFACSSLPAPDDFKGTAFSGERQAQDFSLTDQFGAQRSLRQDFSDKVVVLTFLYTECPDVCPIVANHLRDVANSLRENGPETAFVIISVDPEGDTVEDVLVYSERWGMAGRWSYLVGGEAVLKEVWKAYYIDPYVHGPTRANAGGQPAPTGGSGSGGVSALVEQTGRVIHSAPIYIIDGDGIMRSVFTLPVESEDIVHDVRLLGG